MKKRIISVILAALFLLPLFAFVSFADDTGQLGDNVFWRYDSYNNLLTVYGSGKMYDYKSSKELPSNIKNVIIEEGVENIGAYAFNGCYSIKSVTIPESVKSVDRDAFSYCMGLTSVTLPDGLTAIEENAFTRCESLTTINIPDGVTKIGSNAFYGCPSLLSIIIPNSVKEIGESVFQSCSSLTSVVLSDNITKIAKKSFNYCRLLKSVFIPDGVTSIEESAFDCCSALETIRVPDSVRYIGRNAFEGTAYYYNGKNWDGGEYDRGALYIGNHLIRIGRTKDSTYITRNGTLTIADNAFNMGAVGNLYIPKSIEYIGYYYYFPYLNVYYEGSEADCNNKNLKNSFVKAKWYFNAYTSGGILASIFNDIPKNAWYVDDVLEAYQRGLLVGTGYKTFSPEMPMTRAMFMATIYRMEGEPPVTKDDYFVDVYEGKWYSDAINWAAEVGIVVGVGNGRFNPEESIKREEVAAILFDYTWLHDGNIYDRVDLYKYGDGYKTDFWAFEDMSWAVANGLIVGTGKGLEPRSTATRAQIASILVRYISKFS